MGVLLDFSNCFWFDFDNADWNGLDLVFYEGGVSGFCLLESSFDWMGKAAGSEEIKVLEGEFTTVRQIFRKNGRKTELFVFELLTKLSIGSSSYNGILVFAAVSSIKPRKIRTESADNRSINLIAA
ncbi:hypothetical protein JRO89_XS09G0183100 [Xanthoceras sorbifolium]|uniref:Uncharacterized protein n=1 Tax=Xanthoceras sorbifolium TaxID=99658 RepID=A0ABQ8HLW1_9ROSI|nr:hypothetical protein JRO89_XS09G0183100 [Xanthoceras sorbifolium]